MKKVKKVKIHVTQEDIDNGQPHSISFCPIALACQRQGYSSVRVGTVGIIMTNEYLPLTHRARNFINKFDRNKPVKPTTFILPVE